MWGSRVWGFSESTVRGEGVSLLAVARALRVRTACEQTAAVCRENADCVYFSPEPAGSWGGGYWGGAQPGPSPTSEQRRPTSGVPHFHLRLPSPALGPLPGSSLLKKRACWGTTARNFQPWAGCKHPRRMRTASGTKAFEFGTGESSEAVQQRGG